MLKVPERSCLPPGSRIEFQKTQYNKATRACRKSQNAPAYHPYPFPHSIKPHCVLETPPRYTAVWETSPLGPVGPFGHSSERLDQHLAGVSSQSISAGLQGRLFETQLL